MGKVLTGKGITRYDQGAYGLVGGVAEGLCAAVKLRDAERDELLQLCRQRLDAFRMQRGEEVFAHRSRHRTPISGSVKDRVHRCAQGRCECSGTHEHQRALEVDHIVPTNQRGSDAITNLQALCFRGVQASYGHREAGCVFCALEVSGRVLLENELALCIADAYPVSEGHSLVVQRRHVVGAMGSALQVTLHRVGGPGCDADAEEVLILRPDGAFQWQRQRQGRTVILVADPRQGLLLGRPQHAVFHNLDNQQQAEQSLSADLLIETSLPGEISHVGGRLGHVGFSE